MGGGGVACLSPWHSLSPLSPLHTNNTSVFPPSLSSSTHPSLCLPPLPSLPESGPSRLPLTRCAALGGQPAAVGAGKAAV
eukprot:3246141-Rhodomonas_salina.1